MLRQIIKMLWNTRRHNLWIMLELVVITIVSWAIIDPLFVLKYNQSIPGGYDADGLYRLELVRNLTDTISVPLRDYERIMEELRNYRDIESATCVLRGAYPSSPGNNVSFVYKDTMKVPMSYIPFFPHSSFFQTWRFCSAKDGTWETLENTKFTSGTILMTEDAAKLLSNNKGDLVGKRVYGPDSAEMRVVGLVKPVKMRNSMQPYLIRFVPWLDKMPDWAFKHSVRIFFRTKSGVSEKHFMEEFMPWIDDHLVSGSLVFSKLAPFHLVQSESDIQEGVTNEIRMKYVLAYFFIINLLLAVSGTFWFHTRTRREEIGIRLSYGASPRGIYWMLIREAFVMTTVAVLIGCFLYFQWAYFEGLYKLNDNIPGNDNLYITNYFFYHFIIVTFIVYVLMLIVTWLGVYIPAHTISRISPVEILKDE
ncbi:MAG: FtsX-like permease family protein [Bacteroides sp.]|nr:FtsX-like permease family protein [Bacteroides sp.]MCI1682181.1 FtsX-like permease family protein [Bacteroides sp.]